MRACAEAFRLTLVTAAIPRLLLVGFKYAQPFLIATATSQFSQTKSQNDTYGLMAATAIIYIGIAVCSVHYQHKMYRMVTKLRGGLVALIYDKVLHLSIEETSNNAAVTLMSTDIQGIAGALPMLHDLWASFIEIGIAVWLLERQIGVACVISAVTAFGEIPAALLYA